MKKISILIPAYNESKTIVEVLEQVKLQKEELTEVEIEVIVIDDGSADNTVEVVEQHPDYYTHLVKLEKNGGKGAAVLAGLEKASGDYILFQDADLEYDPADYRKLFMPILKFNADVVMGSRMIAPEFTRVSYFWHKVGNKCITLMFNLLNNTTFTDIYSCYLMYRKGLVSVEDIKTRGWEQHGEILSLAIKRSRVYYEVPVTYRGRTYDEGKKIRWYHIIKVFSTLILTRFR